MRLGIAPSWPRRLVFVVVEKLDLRAGSGGQIGHGGSRHAARPEERVDLPVLESIHRLRDRELLALDVLLGIDPIGLQDADGDGLSAAPGRTGGNALALEILHLLDAAALLRHPLAL